MLRATTVPIEDGLRVASLAGRGRLEASGAGQRPALWRRPPTGDPGRFDARHAHCDVLVIGAGPAGLAAALAAGRSGARTIS